MATSSTMNYLQKHSDIAPPLQDAPFDKDVPQERIYGDYVQDPDNIKHHDINSLATAWLSEFNETLSKLNTNQDAIDKFLMPHTIWKDHQSLQLDFRDYIGPESIKKNVVNTFNEKIGKFEFDTRAHWKYPTGISLEVVHPQGPNGEPGVEWIMLYLKYKSEYGEGRGSIKLVSVKDESAPIGLKALSIFSILDEFASVPEHVGKKRLNGTAHGENIHRKTWLELRHAEQNYGGDHQPLCIVVGGGHSGLTFAARMKAFGYNTLIVESNLKIGDNWRKRYKFLSLHDSFYYHKMPYINTETQPMFSAKDQFANFLECYAKMLELNVWCNSTVTGASFDEAAGKWEVTIKDNSTSEVKRLYPKHVVFAAGLYSTTIVPKFQGEEKFQGEVVHSSQHTSGANYGGKNAVVIGACTSAHDICQDFYEQGVNSVTMVQRSSSCIISTEKAIPIICRGVYEADGPDIDTADLMLHSNPLNLTNMMMQQHYRESSKEDAALINGLEAVGFKTNAGMGATGLFGLAYRRGSGYYIDVGCSKLIMQGKVKLKHAGVERFTKTGIKFDDGTTIDNVDVVVKATGYGTVVDTARKVFGDKVADKLKPVWHFDKEGEFRGIWRPSGHPNFWFMGGNLALARYYSKRLALQIIAQEEGIN